MSCVTEATRTDRDWLRPGECARAMGVHPTTFKKIAARLGIRRRVCPGVNGAMFHREDFDRAMQDMERREAEALAEAQRSIGPPKRIGRPPKSRSTTTTEIETARAR